MIPVVVTAAIVGVIEHDDDERDSEEWGDGEFSEEEWEFIELGR